MTDRFNTPLNMRDEAKFQKWTQENKREGDLADYDMRGWFKKTGGAVPKGHFTDEFKKPNHPTFSNESKYHGGQYQGGSWGGSDAKPIFRAGKTNLENMSKKALEDYFRRREPDATVIFQDVD